jgi:hypothetical protein
MIFLCRYEVASSQRQWRHVADAAAANVGLVWWRCVSRLASAFCHYFRLACQLSVGVTMAHESGGPKSRTTRSGKRFRASAPLHGRKATAESSRLSKRRKAEQRRQGQMSRLRKDAQGLTPSKRCYLQCQSLTELLKLLILLTSLGESLATASTRDPLAPILGPMETSIRWWLPFLCRVRQVGWSHAWCKAEN